MSPVLSPAFMKGLDRDGLGSIDGKHCDALGAVPDSAIAEGLREKSVENGVVKASETVSVVDCLSEVSLP